MPDDSRQAGAKVNPEALKALFDELERQGCSPLDFSDEGDLSQVRVFEVIDLNRLCSVVMCAAPSS